MPRDLKKELIELKKAGEAAEWMTEEGYIILAKGYLLPDETPKGMYKRVAKAAAKGINKPKLEAKFFKYIWNNWLCPATPVLTNLGTDRGLPISCFTIDIGDSVKSITSGLSELAALTKAGGGVGVVMDRIRARGSLIKDGINGESSGVIPFIKMYDSTILGINQGCYDDKTEVLTSKGWVYFEDLTYNHLVAQVGEGREVTFANPTDLIKYKVSENLQSIQSGGGLDLLVTDNHNMVYESNWAPGSRSRKKAWDGKLRLKRADTMNYHRDNASHAAGILPNTKYKLTDEERFMIAFQADGNKTPYLTKEGSYTVTFRLKKERKIKRLKAILDRLGWEYSTLGADAEVFSIKSVEPCFIKPSLDWIALDKIGLSWAESFLDEVSNWDGNITSGGFTYSSIDKISANTVQALASVANKRTTYRADTERPGNRQTLYVVSVNNQYKRLSGDSTKKSTEYYEGFVYCCTVPTHMLLVRRNGCVTVCGNSARRGAASVNLNIEHGDWEEFIRTRRPEGDVNRQCHNIHQCTLINDPFMDKVLAGDIEARKLWTELMRARLETGESYIMWIDKANRGNPIGYTNAGLSVKGTNICSEIMLHTDDEHSFICCLSSLNLARWDEWKDSDLPEIATYFLNGALNEFIDKADGMWGLDKARRSAIKGRAIGIGALGWHTLLQSKMMPMEGFQSMQLNNEIFRYIKEGAVRASTDLATELGEPEWCKGSGQYNSHLIAIAPTRSNSIISGDVSFGIEPIIANAYLDKTHKGKFSRKNKVLKALLKTKGKDDDKTWNSIQENSGSVQHLSFLSDHEKLVFKTAYEVDQKVLVQQASQRGAYVCQAQSLNLFFPHDIDHKYFNDVHLLAYELPHVKTLYYCRSKSGLKVTMNTEDSDCISCES